MNTRAIAATTLERITERGAYSNVLLPQATAQLSSQDRAFVYRLVTDALRNIRRVDDVIDEVAPRGVEGLDPEVLAVLRVAIAEMLVGGSAQIHATVNESVAAIKDLGTPRAAGLVNAILRRLGREGIPATDSFGVEHSVPDWIHRKLVSSHGETEANRLIAGLRRPGPATPLRVRPGAPTPENARAVPGIAGAYYVDGPVESQPGLVFSDPASTAVGLALRPAGGELLLDMAAAPGGKTLHLWDLTGGEAAIVAIDRHRRRLSSARRRLARTGASPLWINGDGRRAPFGDSVFDAVLLDAPCTGLGTLRRRPEIAMRLAEDALSRLAARQRELLAEAWRVVKPGGRIVYSVCTVFAEETIEVVADYPAAVPENLPGRAWGKGLLLAPHSSGTDGMFISVIHRSAD